MFERFTDEARAVVIGARTEAAALGHRFIGTEHLLLALLDATTGSVGGLLAEAGVDKPRVYADIARLEGPQPLLLDEEDAAALRKIGIDLDEVLARIEATFGPLGKPAPSRSRWFVRRWPVGSKRPADDCDEPRPHFSTRSKKVLALALREAARLQHGAIAAEHILLGLIREGEGLAAKILVDEGVDLAELRRRTESALTRAA